MISPGTLLKDTDDLTWVVGAPVPGFDDTVRQGHRSDTPGKPVWIRLVASALDPRGAAAFERRAGAIAGYRHPAAPSGVAYGLDDKRGVRFLVMKATPTRPLSDCCADGATVAQITIWFEQLGRALAQLHAQGLAHSDLSLERIGIDSDGLVVLGPWGFSLPRDPTTIPPGTPLPTTVATLSPEALTGPDADPRSADVYGFGQLLHEALTGSPAFLPGALVSLANAKTALRSLDPGAHIPGNLRAVVQLSTSAAARHRPNMHALMASYTPQGDAAPQVETDWVPMAVRRRAPVSPDAPTADIAAHRPPQHATLKSLTGQVLTESPMPPHMQLYPPAAAPPSRAPWALVLGIGALAGLAVASVTLVGAAALWLQFG